MADYHVAAGLCGIYAGLLSPKDKSCWYRKSDVTEEAIAAVRDYMVDDCLGGTQCDKGTSGGYSWKLKDGRIVELRISIKEEADE